jgi:hypothetical protein
MTRDAPVGSIGHTLNYIGAFAKRFESGMEVGNPACIKDATGALSYQGQAGSAGGR